MEMEEKEDRGSERVLLSRIQTAKERGQEGHVRERVRGAGTVIRRVWGIGERRFAGDWERRIWLFERLAGTVMEYGAEI